MHTFFIYSFFTMPPRKNLVIFIAIFILLVGCSVPKDRLPTTTLESPTLSPTISIKPLLSPSAAQENAQTQVAMTMGTETAMQLQTATILALAPTNPPTIPPPQIITTTPRPTSSPNATSPAQDTTFAQTATEDASGDPCLPDGRTEQNDSDTSPDGKWITFSCSEMDDGESTYLLVSNTESSARWQIFYKDYHRDPEHAYQDRNTIDLFHWSNDGRYLYATSSSIGSGCCWIGWYKLLVRLNLNTGEQVTIFNYTDNIFRMTDISFSPSDRYLLYFSSGNLIILDLLTWENKMVELNYEASAGHAVMSETDDKVILVLREYPDPSQGDITYGSYVIIDLVSGTQTKFSTGMYYDETPLPIKWENEDYVLLQDSRDKLWTLNVHTAELVQVENP